MMIQPISLPLDPPVQLHRRKKSPIPPIVGDECLTEDGRFRYWLVRRWGARRPLMWVCYSPLAGTRDTARTQRMMAWSSRWGFGGLLLVSLYPLRVAKQDDVLPWRNQFRLEANYSEPGEDWDHFMWGVRAARKKAQELRIKDGVAAWGRLDEIGRVDLDTWCEEFSINRGPRAPRWCLGVSTNGDPLHPATHGANRVGEDAELVRFTYPLGRGR
jgi:Protein of unknown function (DUF1643)